eukprot:gene14372-17555_t
MLSSAPTLPVRASHNDMDSLLEEAGDVVFRLDLQGAVLFASKHAMALAGLHSLHGVSLAELTSDTDQPALKAALAGVALGLLIGRSRWAEDALLPPLEMLRPIPAVAWIPLAILMFPSSELSMIFITFTG